MDHATGEARESEVHVSLELSLYAGLLTLMTLHVLSDHSSASAVDELTADVF